MRHRPLLSLALAAVTALTLAACGGGTPEQPKATSDGGSFSFYAYSSGINKLSAANGDNFQLATLLYSSLFTIDPANGKVLPLVAESAESKDQIHWTIKLKPGWKFSNGEAADAKAFVDGWNAMAYAPNALAANYYLSMIEGYADLNPASGKPTKTEMSGLKVVDPTTLQVTTTSPSPQLPYQLANPVLAPISPAGLKALAQEDSAPIGNGPYKLVEFKRGQSVTMTRNDGYGGPAGKAKTITMKIYANGGAAYNDYEAGNLDLVYPVPSDRLAAAQSAHKDGFTWSTLPITTALSFPVKVAPFDKAEVRRALALDIDRKTIADKLLNGSATPADALFGQGVVGAEPGSCGYCTFDSAKATSMLKAAGGISTPIKLYFNSEGTASPVAEAIANQWTKDLGVQVKLMPTPGNQLFELQTKGLDGPSIGGVGLFYPHLENALSIWFLPGAIVNSMKYDNPAVTNLVKAGNSAPAAEGLAKYQEAAKVVLEDLPSAPLYFQRSGVVTTPRLKGAGGGIQGLTDLAKVTVG